MTVRGHELTVRAYGATHTGRVRTDNEDSYFVGDAVFAVADGMGGHQAGEIASDAALEPIRALDVPGMTDPAEVGDALAQAVEQANALVVERARSDPALEGMGTTLTAIAVREGKLHVAHVGDSRAYLLRDNERISQLTTDHTLVERLIQEGRLSRDEAATHPHRNVITRAIGHEATVEVEVLPPIVLQDGDQVLLCSDGLSGPVADDRISAILKESLDGQAAVNGLVAEANAAGGPDNITAVLLRIGDRWPDASEPAGDHSSTQQLTVPGTQPAAAPRGAGASDAAPADAAETDHGGGVAVDLAEDEDDDAHVQPEEPRRSPVGRILFVTLAAVVLFAVVAGAGWLVLSRSFFVGAHGGMIAIYRGLPQEMAGLPLSRVIPEEITTTPVDAFPEFRRREINDGLTAQSLADARRIVEDLQEQARSQQPARGIGTPQPSRGQPPTSGASQAP